MRVRLLVRASACDVAVDCRKCVCVCVGGAFIVGLLALSYTLETSFVYKRISSVFRSQRNSSMLRDCKHFGIHYLFLFINKA